MLFVAKVEVLLEAFDIGPQLLVLISQFRIELLLEVHVTLHVCHFSVPEVELVPLLAVVLLHQGDSSSDISCLLLFLFERGLEDLDPVREGLFVGVEGCSQRLSSLTLLLRLHFLKLELAKTTLDLLLLTSLML